MVFLQVFEYLATWRVLLIETECIARGEESGAEVLQILSFCASCCGVIFYIFWDYMYARFFGKRRGLCLLTFNPLL